MSCREQPNHSVWVWFQARTFQKKLWSKYAETLEEREHFSHHQQHDQAAICVYGQVAHGSNVCGRTAGGAAMVFSPAATDRSSACSTSRIVCSAFYCLLFIPRAAILRRFRQAAASVWARDNDFLQGATGCALDYEL